MRVIDRAGLWGAYCTRLLGDLGAEVVKVEQPGGDEMRRWAPMLALGPGVSESAHFTYYHAGKDSLVIDLDNLDDRQALRTLVEQADVVVQSDPTDTLERLGLASEQLSARCPNLIVCSITGFGLTGPYRRLRSSNAVAHAMGGGMSLVRGRSDVPAPIPGNEIIDLVGTYGALAVLAAWRVVGTVGGQTIDISAQEVVAGHDSLLPKYAAGGVIVAPGSMATVPSGTWPAADGVIDFQVWLPAQWRAFRRLLGDPPELGDEALDDSVKRFERRDELSPLILKWTTAHRVDEIVKQAGVVGVPCSAVIEPADLLRDEQALAADWFEDVKNPPAAAVRLIKSPLHASAPITAPRQSAPNLGTPRAGYRPAAPGRQSAAGPPGSPGASPPGASDQGPGGPLAGVRVISFGETLSGGESRALLADLGADVVRIESLERARRRLWRDPSAVLDRHGVEITPAIGVTGRNSRSVSLDMTKPEDRVTARRLIQHADVLIENFRVGVMDRWDLAPAEVLAGAPRLIYLSMPSFGRHGPHRDRLSYGGTLSAYVGLTRLWSQAQGWAPGEGHRFNEPEGTHNDYVVAVHGALAVLASLALRERTGRGLHLEISQAQCGAALLGAYSATVVDGGPVDDGDKPPLFPGSLMLEVLPCRGDDRWVVVDVADTDGWRQLCALLGAGNLVAPASLHASPEAAAVRRELTDRLRARCQTWTPHQAMLQLQGAGVACGVVQNGEDLYHDPQLWSRRFVVEVQHPDLGTHEYTECPLRLSKTPGRYWRRASTHGEDTEAVLSSWLD
jgi:crotonobetainyl-CoA:carnitine CoA-transferase CaiB-like acyl-CoA transferase